MLFVVDQTRIAICDGVAPQLLGPQLPLPSLLQCAIFVFWAVTKAAPP
jgi:hypothetical protein